jgi:hypothetical protein
MELHQLRYFCAVARTGNFTHAARQHKEAAKHHEAGRHETAAHHAHLGRGHHELAMHHAAEAAKAHIDDHGKVIPAHA